MNKQSKVSDIMIRVPDIKKAVEFWVSVMGMIVIQEADDWTMIKQPDSGRNIVFTTSDFGSSRAVSVSSSDIDNTIATLENQGCRVVSLSKTTKETTLFALCMDQSSIPILIFKE